MRAGGSDRRDEVDFERRQREMIEADYNELNERLTNLMQNQVAIEKLEERNESLIHEKSSQAVEIAELRAQNRELIKSEKQMREEISKLNNTVFNLNSEVQSVKSSLRKTEDEHAKAKELLSLRNSF